VWRRGFISLSFLISIITPPLPHVLQAREFFFVLFLTSIVTLPSRGVDLLNVSTSYKHTAFS
jgi:hypothetical protein